MRDFSDDLAALRRRVGEAFEYLRIEELRAARPQIETEASRPDLWDDPDRARKVNGELSSLVEDIEVYEGLIGRVDDAETLFDLAREEGDDSFEPEVDQAIRRLDADLGENRGQSLNALE